MTSTILAAVSLAFAAIPAYFYFRNRAVFRPAPAVPEPSETPYGPLSVLVPMRDEAANAEGVVRSILNAAQGSSGTIDVEVVALDDGSTDDTAAILQRLAFEGPRVRVVPGGTLPDGWNGKQHACWRLADAAAHDTLLWIDADVRLEPGALPRLLAEHRRGGADLVSGFPRQVTETFLEELLLPLIHFVLLGFLSLRAMRDDGRPGFAAGCGQLFLTTKAAYAAAGGHAAIRASRHDGITLPREYREAGLKTDLFDATDLASCRMYDSAPAVWNGLVKNATEGIATPALLPPVSLALLLGQVAWVPLLVSEGPPAALAALAGACSMAPRADSAFRFRQHRFAWLLHPLAVLLFLAIQWEALVRSLIGRPVAWRGRSATAAISQGEPDQATAKPLR